MADLLGANLVNGGAAPPPKKHSERPAWSVLIVYNIPSKCFDIICRNNYKTVVL